MSAKKRNVAIVGGVTSGRSFIGYARYAGSESVIEEIGSEGDVDVYINSQGGSVFAGFEILNALNSASAAGRSVTIYVSAMAASIASYISSGVKGAKVYMTDNAKLMFHAPWTSVTGSREQLLDVADLLGKMETDIVSAVENRGAKPEKEWFAAGRMKWFSAKEAIEAKLADGIANPPAELLAHVVSTGKALRSSYIWFWDQASDKTEAGARGNKACERIAASTELAGFLAGLCRDQFGEEVAIGDVGDKKFRAIKKDGKEALLKYAPDPLNIVAIEWDSAEFEPKAETDMSKTNQPVAEPKAPVASTSETTPPPAEPKAEVTPPAEPKAPEAKTPEAEPKAEVKPAELPAGMTPDMIAFAAKNYKAVRDGHIAAIRAVDKDGLSDEMLDGFSIDVLAAIAAIAKVASEKAAAGSTPKAAVPPVAPAPAASGTVGGTLPPPEE